MFEKLQEAPSFFRHKRLTTPGVAAILALGLAALPAAATAQDQGGTVSFTASQWRQGVSVYKQSCAGCHGGRLQGMLETPALKGDKFQADWFGKPVSELYTFLSTNMPLTAPGSLEPKQYAAVTAYILKENGIEAGDQELPTDASKMTGTLPAPASK